MRITDWTEDDRLAVLKYFNRTDEGLKEDVAKLREWLEKQKHLPKIPDDTLIGNFLILNKFSLEKTKRKIDWFYTIRGLIPEFYSTPVDDPKLINIARTSVLVPLPKLTPNLERIYWYKLFDSDISKFDVMLHFTNFIQLGDLMISEDMGVSLIIISDMTGYTLGHVAKFTPVLIKKMHTVLHKVYSSRYSGFHFIHPGSVVDGLIGVLKMVMPEKLAKRVHMHKSVAEMIEKSGLTSDLIPSEYGGAQPSLEQLSERLIQCKIERKQYLTELQKLRTNEDLREGDKIGDDFFGVHGNFRKLDVD